MPILTMISASRRFLISATAAFAALLVAPAEAAVNERRVALVIGNSEYAHVAPLENPLIDSKAVAASLKRLGFEVVEGYNLNMEAMRATVGAGSGRERRFIVSIPIRSRDSALSVAASSAQASSASESAGCEPNLAWKRK